MENIFQGRSQNSIYELVCKNTAGSTVSNFQNVAQHVRGLETVNKVAQSRGIASEIFLEFKIFEIGSRSWENEHREVGGTDFL